MLCIKTKKQAIAGKYAKRLTELICSGEDGSHIPNGNNQTGDNFLSKEKYEVVWEYWSSTFYGGLLARCLTFYSGAFNTNNYYRSYGLSVRPVTE